MARLFCSSLDRRHLLALTGATAASMIIGRSAQAAISGDRIVACPYFPQGGSGEHEYFNCGPASVAMGINYSGVATPTVEDVRTALGRGGATSFEDWTMLLDMFAVPYWITGGKEEIDAAIRAGNVVIVSATMSLVSVAEDFNQPLSPHKPYVGRFSTFEGGHAMVIVGLANDGLDYVVHDPWVFPNDPVGFYDDGTPKGQFRQYNAGELWNTIASAGSWNGVAVPPTNQPDLLKADLEPVPVPTSRVPQPR